MCGIYGITGHNPTFIQNYINRCKHRGPDGQKVWWDPNNQLTLGHNLLSIMGNPKLSTQPWKTPKGNWLVYNGEIFNYYELKAKYKGHGFAGITGCDTELLAWGLDTFGIEFIRQIDSMHGFAYYDVSQNQLILSRDHAGIKPLYYAEINEGLVFGSELRGLLDIVPGARTLDKMAHSIWHYMSVNPLPNTFFSNIKKLLPGETLVYDLKNKKFIKTQRDYIKPISNTNNFDMEEFRTTVKDAVSMCSIGDKKIGVFLSGGTDSSMIAYELHKLQGHVNSFTTRWTPDPKTIHEDYNDDANMAKKLAGDFGFDHIEVNIDPKVYAEYWNDSVISAEQLMRNPSLPAYLYTNKVMKDHNIKVTMAGDLGDELLCGYPRHGTISGLDSWRNICKLLVTGQKTAGKVNNNLYSRDEVLEEFMKHYTDDLYNDKDPLGSFCALEVTAICPEDMLIRNDKFGMAYSMEGRYPLGTKKFMKYCMNIHSKQKMIHLKHIPKASYTNVLPKYITTKKKTGWTAPMGYWMKGHKCLLDLHEQKLKKPFNMQKDINQKTGKRLAVDMQWATWFEHFQVENY